MQGREAACSCGQLRVTTEGDPVRISMCHCLACQRRTGSAFGMQARWPEDRVNVTGRYTEYVRISDADEERTFRFCPDCGATVFWTNDDPSPFTGRNGMAVPSGWDRGERLVHASAALPEVVRSVGWRRICGRKLG